MYAGSADVVAVPAQQRQQYKHEQRQPRALCVLVPDTRVHGTLNRHTVATSAWTSDDKLQVRLRA